MAMTRDDAFGVLELHRDATSEEIRASYKRLALRWHPDKHSNSPDSTKKFQEVSSAYKRLTTNESTDEIHLSRADMFDIFAHVFFHQNGLYDYSQCNQYESDDDYSDDDDDIENKLLHNIATRLRHKYDRSKTTNYSKTNSQPAHTLSEAEALKNAEELIKEEEKDRKKAEKRRQKKKRNKEKKKQKEKETDKEPEEKENKKIHVHDIDKEKNPTIQTEKLNLKDNQDIPIESSVNIPMSKPHQTCSTVKENNTNSYSKKEQDKSKDSKRNTLNGETDSSQDEPDWDESSAFFARAAGRNPSSNPTNGTTTISHNTSTINTASSADTQTNKNTNDKETISEQLDPVILQSRQLAVRGNEMANLSNYTAAIELFTEAIKLDARDFRFFGNRSYCYDRLGQCEKALQDADVAISLAPDWPKGYFRRGRALAGIKLFSDSEIAFAQVLKLDKHCEDAMFELARVRVQQLEDMGFPTIQSEAAIHTYGTVQSALEALLAGKVHCPKTDEIYVSDGEEDKTKIRAAQNISTSMPLDANNGLCKSVWVGNVNAEVVTEAELQKIFARSGKIESVKVLPTRFCAFINYSTGEAAARAIATLQGFDVGGQNLLLRYPNNSGVPLTLQPQVIESAGFSRPKLTGPVNGDECYFWRTTGCSFGDRCRNKHSYESKGMDLRKVEAKYGGKM